MDTKNIRKRIKLPKIRTIIPATLEIFTPTGKSCGELNELEVLDLRCSIKRHKLVGYYFYYKGEKIKILPTGFYSKDVNLFTQDIIMRNYLLGIDNQLYLSEIDDNE